MITKVLNPFKSGLFKTIIILMIIQIIIIIFAVILTSNAYILDNNLAIFIITDIFNLLMILYLSKKYEIFIGYFFSKNYNIKSYFKEIKPVFYFIPTVYSLSILIFSLNGIDIKNDYLLKLSPTNDVNSLLQNILVVFYVCITTPILEEIIFRGFLFHRLSIKWNVRESILFSSLFFGLLHGFAFVPISILGTIFCLIYIRTNSLYYSIFAHCTYNLIILILKNFLPESSFANKFTVLNGLICLGILIYCIPKLIKYYDLNFVGAYNYMSLPYFYNLEKDYGELEILYEEKYKKLIVINYLKFFSITIAILFIVSIVGIYYLDSYSNRNVYITEKQINSYYKGKQENSSIALNTDSGIVAWQSEKQDGSGWGIYTKKFQLYDGKMGHEQQVNERNLGDQENPYISYISENKYLVAWKNDKKEIYARVIDANNNPLGNEFKVSNNIYNKDGPIVLTNKENCSCDFYILWKNPQSKSISIKKYNKDIFNVSNKEIEINIPNYVSNKNLKFALYNKKIFMVGKQDKKILLYTLDLENKKVINSLLINNNGFNPNIHSSKNEVLTVSWEDTQNENYLLKAKSFDVNLKQILGHPEIIKRSNSERYKKSSVFMIDNNIISLWEANDINTEKGIVSAFSNIILVALGLIDESEGIFISNIVNTFEDTSNTQINTIGTGRQTNYSFDYFNDESDIYISTSWQSEKMNNKDTDIFVNVLINDEEMVSYW